jgi:hypothetical protein
VICNNCNGIGYIKKNIKSKIDKRITITESIDILCSICNGKDKVDWISNIFPDPQFKINNEDLEYMEIIDLLPYYRSSEFQIVSRNNSVNYGDHWNKVV